MKPQNIKEFQALVKRYETITLKEINDKRNELDIIEYPHLANRLTGFCSYRTCTLCIAVGVTVFSLNRCLYCVYGADRLCSRNINSKTYSRIEKADTPRKLLNAYRARAKHLRKHYNQYLINETK